MPANLSVKLTQFSHGAGCGCKISPAVLDVILKNNQTDFRQPGSRHLLVGNSSRDDAAVYDLGNGKALISTTDFFMPIVDDAFDFGRIASANAISDVYAMGGTPILAIAILGWPIGKIAPEIAGKVIEGARALCNEAGIQLAGGHSIDSPEPVFGLAVNGLVNIEHLKRNDTAKEGDLLFLTKPMGLGILSTASKNGLLAEEHLKLSVNLMTTLNKIGEELGKIKGVNALTDVTGFGLLGHLCEMAEGSGLSAEISFGAVPVISGIDYYLEKNCVPGGTGRNWKSYGHKISFSPLSLGEGPACHAPEFGRVLSTLCDPQTSGGLLVSVAPAEVEDYRNAVKKFNPGSEFENPIGRFFSKKDFRVIVTE